MWNIIFLGVDEVNNYFQETKDSMAELAELGNNINAITEGENTLLLFVSDTNMSEVEYNASLLMNYFNTYAQSNIVIGPLITKDYLADLCVRDGFRNEVVLCDENPVDIKQNEMIDMIGKENISKIIHVTNGIKYKVDQNVESVPNIVMFVGCPLSINQFEHDTQGGRDVTYLISQENGIKGFNNCFDTYHKNTNSVKLSR